MFQRYFLFQKEAYLIHLYNVFTGLSIAYFNFGKMSLGRESCLAQGLLWFERICSRKNVISPSSLSFSCPTGMQFCHSLLCVLIQFLILRLMGRTITAVFTTFFFQMVKLPFLLHLFVERSPLFCFALPSSNSGWKSGDRSKTVRGISLNNSNNGLFQTYLMAGYYFTATEHYDIKWTMPHCVLTLKLIGE